MKLKDIVAEAYAEGETSTFSHEGNRYKVDDVIALANKKQTVDFNLSKLQWLETEPADEQRIQRADATVPVIVVEYEPNKWATLDGFHRARKAIKAGDATIPAKIVTPNEVASLPKI